MNIKRLNYLLFSLVLLVFGMDVNRFAGATEWSVTELQFQHGNLSVPSFAGVGTEGTSTFTLQHSSGWKYGSNFFFVDIINSSKENGFNDRDIYTEMYSTLSLEKLTRKKIDFGYLSDIGLVVGINIDADANVQKYLPGISLSWSIPNFSFINTKFIYYIDDNKGVSSGGAPKEGNGFMFDVSWAYPFWFRSYKFSFEGHAEYLTALNNELGGKSSEWILAQPQIRWYVTESLALGIEYQYWMNKLGDGDTDESAPQLLVVWVL